MGSAWGYARGSLLPDFLTVEEQQRRIEDYAKARLAELYWAGTTVDDLRTVGRSKFLDRPCAAQLNTLMTRGDHLVMASLGRGFRSLRDLYFCYQQWEQRGIVLHLLDHGDEALGPFIAALAAWEQEAFDERHKDLRAYAISIGRPTWAERRRFGFKIVGRKYHRKRVPDLDERAKMGEIVQLFSEGCGWTEISKIFAEKGYKARVVAGRRRRWTASRVQKAYQAEIGLREQGL